MSNDLVPMKEDAKNNIVSSNVEKFKQAELLNKEQAKNIYKTLTIPKHLLSSDEESTINLLALAVAQCNELKIPAVTYFSKFFPVNGVLQPSIHIWYYLASKNKIEVDVLEDRVIVDRETLDSKGEVSKVKDFRTTVQIRYYNPVLKTIEHKKESVYWSEIVKAGLHTKEAYIKYPGIQMRHWCFRQLIRTNRQDILGNIEIYTAEEIMDFSNINYSYDSEGNLITK